MVILWTNIEGEKVEPSATRHGVNPVRPAMGLKRRVQVALKPSLPSLFLPQLKASSPTPSSPGDSVSLPSSIGSCDVDDASLVLVRSGGDLSPDSGVLIRSASSTPDHANSDKPRLPIVYGTRG